MRFIIIGSTGQLGHDLMRVFGPEAIGLSHQQDIEITDPASVARALEGRKADWVLNAAAYNQVQNCENIRGLADSINTAGAENVARSAGVIGAGVVFFSTDYVFDGRDRGPNQPYEEHDQTGPLSVYGASKLAGERRVMAVNPRHLVIRTCGLFGLHTSHKGWTFPELMLQKARAGEKLRVVTDQVVSPTFTADLADKVKELVFRNAEGLFHLTNSGECSWFEFARETLLLTGVPAKVEPITTVHVAHAAVRPAYSALRSARLREFGIQPMRPWREALKDYLFQKGMLAGKS
jgi:dTDP-4-dehydrorhamnose reductase